MKTLLNLSLLNLCLFIINAATSLFKSESLFRVTGWLIPFALVAIAIIILFFINNAEKKTVYILLKIIIINAFTFIPYYLYTTITIYDK